MVCANYLYLLVALICHGVTSFKLADVRDPEKIEYRGEEERIIGGKPAEDGQFPWAAALEYNGRFICTASIISPDTILTAAHCVQFDDSPEPAESFVGVLGSADRTSSSATRVNFRSLTVHPNYIRQNITNDIAIFRLTDPVTFNDNIQPVCLARADTEQSEYKNATIMGWGRTSRIPFMPLPRVLQYKENKILPHDTCKLRYLGSVTDDMICADGFGTGICSGDSGGPFTYVSPSKTVQLGVASFGRIGGCGSLILSPGVFTRVSAYRDWISEAAPDAELCSV